MMKIATLLLLFLCASPLLAQNNSANSRLMEDEVCSDDHRISYYPRRRVLHLMAKLMLKNKSLIPKVSQYEDDETLGEAIYKSGRPYMFDVTDLVDTDNKADPSKGCINFIENHIYHFYSVFLSNSHSYIVIPQDKDLKVFQRVNCRLIGDNTIEDVLQFVEPFLRDNIKHDEIIQRIKDYRKFGEYISIDTTEVICSEIHTKSGKFNPAKPKKGEPLSITIWKKLPQKLVK